MAETIKDLKFDSRNFNKHTDRGMELLEKSIRENKFGRSVLVDKDGNIIAGNATVETARKLGKDKIKVIETTGDELVVVKRTDLDIDSKEARELALADNAVGSANLQWDKEELARAAEDFGIAPEDWDVAAADEPDEDKLNPYTMKVDKIIYEPQGEKPNIKDCIDLSKVEKLLEAIEKSSATDEEKEVLRACAYRHAIISFKDMAEYYCHASAEVQELFEQNALVIIDFNRAIEDGYVQMRKDLFDLLDDELDG